MCERDGSCVSHLAILFSLLLSRKSVFLLKLLVCSFLLCSSLPAFISYYLPFSDLFSVIKFFPSLFLSYDFNILPSSLLSPFVCLPFLQSYFFPLIPN